MRSSTDIERERRYRAMLENEAEVIRRQREAVSAGTHEMEMNAMRAKLQQYIDRYGEL